MLSEAIQCCLKLTEAFPSYPTLSPANHQITIGECNELTADTTLTARSPLIRHRTLVITSHQIDLSAFEDFARSFSSRIKEESKENQRRGKKKKRLRISLLNLIPLQILKKNTNKICAALSLGLI